MMRILSLTLVGLTLTLFGPTAVSAQTGDAAFAHFNQEVKAYLSLVQKLHREVPELRVTNKSAEISNRSDMLAGAIERARQGAPQGAFFDAAAAGVIRKRLAGALHGQNTASLLKKIDDAPILKGPPDIHLRFPVTTSMATMPARLLAELPPLPKALEYRFVGRALVLRDRDAALILDYLPDALPAP